MVLVTPNKHQLIAGMHAPLILLRDPISHNSIHSLSLPGSRERDVSYYHLVSFFLFCERIFCEHPRCLDTPTIIHTLSTYLYVRPLFFSFERGPKRDQEGYYFFVSTILFMPVSCMM
jgi:hypothetical protein